MGGNHRNQRKPTQTQRGHALELHIDSHPSLGLELGAVAWQSYPQSINQSIHQSIHRSINQGLFI